MNSEVVGSAELFAAQHACFLLLLNTGETRHHGEKNTGNSPFSLIIFYQTNSRCRTFLLQKSYIYILLKTRAVGVHILLEGGGKATVDGLDVPVEVAAVVEGLVADDAPEGAGPCVDAGVDDQVLPAGEEFPADAAHLNTREGGEGLVRPIS